MKFLAGDGSLVHQAALRDRKHRYTFVVLAPRNCTVRVYACPSTGAGRACRSRGARGDRNRADVSAEFEPTRFELVQGTLVFEKDDLAISLAAGLKSDSKLPQGHVPNVPSVHVHATFAKGSADSDGSLADRWEYGVTVAVAKEARRLVRFLESLNRVAIGAGMGQAGD